jgi:hypothetical protein
MLAAAGGKQSFVEGLRSMEGFGCTGGIGKP